MQPENQNQTPQTEFQNHEVNPPKKPKTLIWAVVLILILLVAGTVAAYFALNLENKETEETENSNIQKSEEKLQNVDLITYDLRKKELVKLVLNSETQLYQEFARTPIKQSKDGVVIDENIYITSNNKVIKLDLNLNELKVKELEEEMKVGDDVSLSGAFPIVGIATDGENIFVTRNKEFIAFDKDLNILDKIQLREKTAHDILVFNDKAYLLDNVVQPIYLFVVDIKDPKKMKVLDEVEIKGLELHLDNQWLNSDLNQWMVLQSSSYMTGRSQDLKVLRMENPTEVISSTNIYKKSRDNSDNYSERGFEILDVTSTYPAWALTRKSEDNKYYVSRITNKSQQVSSDPIEIETQFFEIEQLNAENGYIEKFGDFLYIVTPLTNEISVYRIEDSKLNIVSTVNLNSLGISNVSYLLFFGAERTQESVTSDWQTYQNEEFGFEFKYPSSWVIQKEEKRIPVKDYEPLMSILDIELVDKNSGEFRLRARLLPSEASNPFEDNYKKMAYFNGGKTGEISIDGFKTIIHNQGCYECYYGEGEDNESLEEWKKRIEKIRIQPISLTCNTSGVCLQIHMTTSLIADQDLRIFFMENFLPTLKFNKESFESIEYEFQPSRG